jgi:hypothetical protein
MGDATERVWFPSTSGPTLAGLIDHPQTPSRGWGGLTLRRHFIEDLGAANLREQIRTLHRAALLVMHSPTDNTVGIENASESFRAEPHPRSFVSLEGADHLLTGRNQATRAARIISAWADPSLAQP